MDADCESPTPLDSNGTIQALKELRSNGHFWGVFVSSDECFSGWKNAVVRDVGFDSKIGTLPFPITVGSKYDFAPGEFVVGFKIEQYARDNLILEHTDNCAILIREWHDFKESLSYSSLYDFIQFNENIHLTPKHKILYRTLLIYDEGFLFHGFKINYESGLVSAELVRRSKQKIEKTDFPKFFFIYNSGSLIQYGDDSFVLVKPFSNKENKVYFEDESFWETVLIPSKKQLQPDEDLVDKSWNSPTGNKAKDALLSSLQDSPMLLATTGEIPSVNALTKCSFLKLKALLSGLAEIDIKVVNNVEWCGLANQSPIYWDKAYIRKKTQQKDCLFFQKARFIFGVLKEKRSSVTGMVSGYFIKDAIEDGGQVNYKDVDLPPGGYDPAIPGWEIGCFSVARAIKDAGWILQRNGIKECPVQLVPWKEAIRNSKDYPSAVDYFKNEKEGHVETSYLYLLNHIIIHDEDSGVYLSGFTLNNSQKLIFNNVKVLNQLQFEDIWKSCQGREISYKGEKSGILIPWSKGDQHPVLDNAKWESLSRSLNPTINDILKISEAYLKNEGWILEPKLLDVVLKTYPKLTFPIEDYKSLRELLENDKHIEIQDSREGRAYYHISSSNEDGQGISGNRGFPNTEKESARTPDSSTLHPQPSDFLDSHTQNSLSPIYTTEDAFLRNLLEVAKGKCHYSYSSRDIIRFHTSVKNFPLTVIGGNPGTGKSSLIEIYARALLGDAFRVGDPKESSFLQVNVSPAWAEPADLLGFQSPTGFHEASNGLCPFLKSAMGDPLEMRLCCLEEINLACVEHYFSDFMQVLSRKTNRIIPGYEEKEEGKNAKPLELSDNVRFAGTCNFDETVKPMSSRFYDRCNYLELTEGKTVGFPEYEPTINSEDFKGIFTQQITREELTAWQKPLNPLLDVSMELVNETLEKLQKIDLVPSRRVLAEIKQYILSRPKNPDDTTECQLETLQRHAIDEAVAQRILSKYRPDPFIKQDDVRTYIEENGFALSLQFFDTLNKRYRIPEF